MVADSHTLHTACAHHQTGTGLSIHAEIHLSAPHIVVPTDLIGPRRASANSTRNKGEGRVTIL